MVSAQPVVVPVHPSVEESGVCAVCPHDLATHDRISLRFCQATQGSATTRGCVCPSS
jgi:hypothetical protein